MRLEDLLQDLKHQMGITSLELDAQGICRLVINNAVLVSLEQSLDSPGFYLYSVVGTVPPAKEKTISVQALSGNLFGKETGKANLGYLPDTNTLVLFEYIPEEGTTLVSFKKILEEFLAYLTVWHEKLEMTAPSPESIQQSRLMPGRSGGLQIFFA